jgi:hypothetical protein
MLSKTTVRVHVVQILMTYFNEFRICLRVMILLVVNKSM